MNKKNFLAAVLAFCMMLTLCACGGEAATETPADTTAPTESTTSATEATAPTAPTPADGEVLYTIKVVDTEGNPVAGVYVQLCLDVCVFTATDTQGIAYFCKPEAEYKVAFTEAPEIYYYFENGSHEMTLVYDLGATEPSTNDVELQW